MSHKTTRAEERYFEARVKHWQKALGLLDWRVNAYMQKLDDRAAECEQWFEAHGAHIRLNTEQEHRPSKQHLDRVALHEVCHLLLSDMKGLIYSRTVTENQANTIEHGIIRRLENALCGQP